MWDKIIIAVLIAVAVGTAVAVFVALRWVYKNNGKKAKVEIMPDKEKIDVLLKYVETQKEEAEAKQRIANLKKAEQKEKLEKFKQTRESLRDELKNKFDMKEWIPLSKILKSADKGNVGVYVLYNSTKNKYYVGQAKALVTRIKKHFEVEDIARDFLSGDSISVKVLTATELGDDYRIDHIEKLGIEIYDAEKNGYNKTGGNL
jgi:predicted GIY-YIG superfamily endonuclease